MAKNYAAGGGIGDNGLPVKANNPAPFKAIATYADENGAASSVITLTQNTTAIEIAAQSAPALMRWVGTADSEASVFGNASIMNFDHVIPANTVRRFVVPIESGANTTFGATITSVQGQNREYGLFRRVAFASNGISSVYLTEYGKSNSY